MQREHFPENTEQGSSPEDLLEGADILPALSNAILDELEGRQRQFFKRAHELRNFMPDGDPTIPEYNGDVAGFIARGRKAFAEITVDPKVFRLSPDDDKNDLSPEDAIILRHYGAWAKGRVRDQIYPLIRQGSKAFYFDGEAAYGTYQGTLASYMLGTIKAVTSFNRTYADERFKAARREVLGTVIPATATQARDRIKQDKLRAVTLLSAERQLKSLPYIAPNADFFALEQSKQREIVAAIGEEFLTFVKYAARYGDAAALHEVTCPAMMRPIRDLEALLEVSEDPRLDFLRYTHDLPAFDARVAEVRAQAEMGEPTELSFSQKLLTLPVGEVLPMIGSEETIRVNDLRRGVNDALDAVITELYGVNFTGIPNLEVNKNWRADNKDITERLVAKSNGRISNVRFQALDAQEFLETVAANWDPEITPVDTARAFAILADIRSGSKKVPTSFEFAIYITRNKSGETGRVVKSVRGRSTGDKVIQDEAARSKKAGRFLAARKGIVNKAGRAASTGDFTSEITD